MELAATSVQGGWVGLERGKGERKAFALPLTVSSGKAVRGNTSAHLRKTRFLYEHAKYASPGVDRDDASGNIWAATSCEVFLTDMLFFVARQVCNCVGHRVAGAARNQASANGHQRPTLRHLTDAMQPQNSVQASRAKIQAVVVQIADSAPHPYQV